MPTATAEKIDLYKLHKADYVAGKEPQLVKVSPAKYLTIEGRGEPGGKQFEEKIGGLYAMAYTIKMTEKFAGNDYKVCALEGQWWCADPKNWADQPRDSWQWKLMIRVPDFIGSRQMKAALEKLAKKGKAEVASEVLLEKISEGRCVQMLHVGPYANEPESIQRMLDFAAANGLQFSGRHHEIYLSDPRRVAPEKLKTILRHPVEQH